MLGTDGFSLSLILVCVHEVQQHIPAPSILQCLLHKGHGLLRFVKESVDDVFVMSPRDAPNRILLKFTHKLWMNCKVFIVKHIESLGISYTILISYLLIPYANIDIICGILHRQNKENVFL